MLSLSNKSPASWRALQRQLAAGMATAAPRIGDTKVPMSLLEKDSFINYQRIEDNLAIVRERCVLSPRVPYLQPPHASATDSSDL